MTALFLTGNTVQQLAAWSNTAAAAEPLVDAFLPVGIALIAAISGPTLRRTVSHYQHRTPA